MGGQLLCTSGPDTLVGTDDDDTIFGLKRNDNLRGEGGDDYIAGNAGNDEINDGPGRDKVWGGSGDDRIGLLGLDEEGLKGGDKAWGGSGDDEIFQSSDVWKSCIWWTRRRQNYSTVPFVKGGPGNDIIEFRDCGGSSFRWQWNMQTYWEEITESNFMEASETTYSVVVR